VNQKRIALVRIQNGVQRVHHVLPYDIGVARLGIFSMFAIFKLEK
jgi:hypothetical protein